MLAGVLIFGGCVLLLPAVYLYYALTRNSLRWAVSLALLAILLILVGGVISTSN